MAKNTAKGPSMLTGGVSHMPRGGLRRPLGSAESNVECSAELNNQKNWGKYKKFRFFLLIAIFSLLTWHNNSNI